MGTSVSQRSPSTLNWHIVETGYTKEEIPIDRLTQEIWRAASNQPEGNLFSDLSAPLIARCVHIVESSTNRIEAIQLIRLATVQSGSTSLAVEIAQRAVIPAFQSGVDRTGTFVRSLFTEAGNYLVSRDMPGFIGKGRVNNVSDAIVFKNDIRRNIAQKVSEVSTPAGNISNATVWKDYVDRIVLHISGAK
ncbi:MAG: hypothetical protein PHQ40_03030 [Anaerolineaceae bacterium]|nr:hypothetical protein [Anaerolineaceae bacterium]